MKGSSTQKPTSKGEGLTLLKEIQKTKIAPKVLLIVCQEKIRQERSLDLIKEVMPTASVQRFDARSLRIPQFEEALSSLSLFNPASLYVVDSMEEVTAQVMKDLATIAHGREFNGSVVFLAKKLPANSAFLKSFTVAHTAIIFPELSGLELKRWVGKELQRNGVEKFGEEEIEFLIRIGEESPDQLVTLCGHISLAVDGNEVTTAQIREIFSYSPVADEFELLASLGERNPARRIVLLHHLFRSGKNAFLLLSLLARSFSQYLSIKSLMNEGRSSADIRQALGISPWVFQKYLDACGRYSLQSLKRHQKMIVRADSKLKNKSLGPEEVIGELLESLCR